MATSIRLEGNHVPFAKDELEGVVDSATYLTREDGTQEFILRGHDENSTAWEAHLYSSDGREFSGRMSSLDWDPYRVDMELWLSPSGHNEFLLLGTYQCEDRSDDSVGWRITLWPPEDD